VIEHERIHSRLNRGHHCGGSSIRIIMGGLHMGSNIEKTYDEMNDEERSILEIEICFSQPLGKRGLDEFMGVEYANSVVYTRTAKQIKKDIKTFQELIIEGKHHD